MTAGSGDDALGPLDRLGTGLSGVCVSGRVVPSRGGRGLFGALPGLALPRLNPSFDGGTCELLDVLRGRPTSASSSVTRAASRSIRSCCCASRASFSTSLNLKRGGSGMNRMNQILAPAATLSRQPREQLPRDSDTFEQVDAERRLVWTHKFYSEPEDGMSSAAIQYEVHCGTRALREGLYIDYDAGEAELRRGDNTQADQWRLVSAGTVGGSIVGFTCTSPLARKAQYVEVAATADYREVGRFYADSRSVVPVAPPTPAQSARPAAAVSAAAMQAGQRYKSCALAAARRFASSGETAPVVADAAIADCASARRALAAAFSGDPNLGGNGANIAMERFNNLLRPQLRLEVVRAKSRR